MPDSWGDAYSVKARQCMGKQRYLSLAEAELQARHMHKLKKARFSAYECQWCQRWHVGQNRSREAARRRESKRSTQG